MNEDIALCLKIAGVTLTSQDFELLGIPGFETSMLYKGEASPYEVEKQWFAFQLSTTDTVENIISLDDQFTIEDTAFSYTFVVARTPIPDLTGFSKLHADFLSKTPL